MRGGEDLKSEWRVTSNLIGDEKIYQVYRLLDINAVDHSGNRHYYAGYTARDKEKAKIVASALNRAEQEMAKPPAATDGPSGEPFD